MPVVSETNEQLKLLFPSVKPSRIRLSSEEHWSLGNIVPVALPSNPRECLSQIESSLESDITAKLAQTVPASSPGQVSGGGTISDSDLCEMAIQTWRLQNRISNLDPKEHKRVRKQLTDSARRFAKILERFDVEFEDLTGRPYVTGWQEVEVVAWEDPEGKESPVESLFEHSL